MAQIQEQYRAQLLIQAREASQHSGVYLMKSTDDGVLYVGKAKNLKNRLTTYFQPARHENLRTEILVGQVHHFDVILTETENEALILECTLIKRYKPKFNILLKDDKNFPYIKIQLSDRAPRLEWTRRVLRDGARYYGPFPSAYSARQVLQLLNETLKLRDCSDNTFRNRSRPCVLYQIDKCSAPCVQKITESQYRESILEAISVLEGKGEQLVDSLRKGMEDASRLQEYEKAASYRDQIQNIEMVLETQGVLDPTQRHDRDVLAVARKDALSHGVVLMIRGGKLLGVKHYRIQGDGHGMGDAEVMDQFITQHYAPLLKAPEGTPPREILLRTPPSDVSLMERALGVTVRVPESKEEDQLVRVAEINSQHAVDTEAKRQSVHGAEALDDVHKRLHLDSFPHRIECYDISNFQGEGSVASRVVFVNGSPEKNLYRRYRIRGSNPQGGVPTEQNDFAMMKEVLERRFLRKDDPFPQLVVVDGGKGQLSQAVAILEELQVQGVEVVSLAKSRVKNSFKETGTYEKEVQVSPERIFIPNRKNPVVLLPHTSGARLLTHLRDEAHRFAVSYHRIVRHRARMPE